MLKSSIVLYISVNEIRKEKITSSLRSGKEVVALTICRWYESIPGNPKRIMAKLMQTQRKTSIRRKIKLA